MTDEQLIIRWQRVLREHGEYVRGNRGRVPHTMLDEIRRLRREGYSRGIDMEAIPPAPRERAVIERELGDIERRMERLYRHVASRAQATTREARLGQLAMRRDALIEELRRAQAAAGE